MTLLIVHIVPDQRPAANAMADAMQFAIDGTHNGLRSFDGAPYLYDIHTTDDSTPVAAPRAVVLTPENRISVGQALLTPTFAGAFVGDFDPVADPGYFDTILTQLNLRRAKATI